MLAVPLKNHPAAPPTVWLVYPVPGGASDAAVATVIRSAMIAVRFPKVAVAIAVRLSGCPEA